MFPTPSSLSFPSSLLAVAVTLALPAVAQVQSFLSNPYIAPPSLNITTNVAGSVQDGMMFFTPFQNAQPGSLIFDGNGTLIWDGSALNLPQFSHDLSVVEYDGSPHLSFINSTQLNGYARGSGAILDSSYTPVKTVVPGNGGPGVDQHEFNVINSGETALITIYEQSQVETGIENVTWVNNCVFQELDIATGAVLFEWKSADHVSTNMTYTMPKSTNIAGDGLTNNTAWDYFHINAVSKFANGDYLVSGRHVKTIYRISKIDGSIVWKLGGKESDFTMDYQFNFQHHARIVVEQSDTAVTISLYDNGADDAAPNPGQSKPGYEPYSSGIVATVDTVAKASKITERYVSPNKQSSHSMGNLQILPNSSYFMGMGNVPVAIEFTNNATGTGEVVFYAMLSWGVGSAGYPSYRNFKFPWSATPAAPPDVFSYALNCTSETVVYASWNGATEVASWRLSSGLSANGAFTAAAPVAKAGFETVMTVPSYQPYAFADALDAQGNVLHTSNTVQTFVPAPALAVNCTTTACPPGTNYVTSAKGACAVPLSNSTSTTSLVASSSALTMSTVTLPLSTVAVIASPTPTGNGEDVCDA